MDSDSLKYSPPLPDFSPWLVSAWQWFSDLYPHLAIFVKNIYGIVVGLSIVLSILFFIGIIFCVESLKMMRNKEEEIFERKVEPGYEEVKVGDNVMASRWKKALAYVDSDNQNDWKQAIIEADIILDDILNKLGYHGDSIGDKLKRVATGDMKSLNEAWEAHKVRNQIAHEPGFSLNHQEAKNAIGMYRKVFEEFYYI